MNFHSLQEALKQHGYGLERCSEWFLEAEMPGYVVLERGTEIRRCPNLSAVQTFLQSLKDEPVASKPQGIYQTPLF